jgi:hypothetical protein
MPAEPVSALAAAFGNHMIARIFASPVSAASTAKWARAYDALVHKPGQRSLATFTTATKQLASSTAPQIGWKGSVDDLSQRIAASTQGAPEGETQ